MTKPATRHSKPPAAPEGRPRPRMYTAPTCLLDLPQPLMEALQRVAPKERLPKIAYVLALVAGVVMFVLYGVLADAVAERVKSAPAPEPSASEAFASSSSPSTDDDQSACVGPPAPSAASADERPPPSPAARPVAAETNRSKAGTGAKWRTSR